MGHDRHQKRLKKCLEACGAERVASDRGRHVKWRLPDGRCLVHAATGERRCALNALTDLRRLLGGRLPDESLTGRIRKDDGPKPQNILTRTKLGREIREAFTDNGQLPSLLAELLKAGIKTEGEEA